jgi:hypothetical protein
LSDLAYDMVSDQRERNVSVRPKPLDNPIFAVVADEEGGFKVARAETRTEVERSDRRWNPSVEFGNQSGPFKRVKHGQEPTGMISFPRPSVA